MEIKNLGRYELLEVLGQGTMGTVYKAQDTVIERIVAIKTIKNIGTDTKPGNETTIKSFFKEAKIFGKLTHPSIVVIYDIGEDKGIPYVVMEYIDGKPLYDVIHKKKNLPLGEKIGIVKEAALALHYAHQNNIIHRDIKPANIMLLKKNKVKIMDFGIGMFLNEGISEDMHNGTISGTPSYMSPEQIRGKMTDRQSDIFSLGVVTYEFLTGSKPFTGKNISELMKNIQEEQPAPLKELNPMIPEELSSIVLQMLEKKKDQRIPSMEIFADKLEIYLNKIEFESTLIIQNEKKSITDRLLSSLKENYTFFSDFSHDELQSVIAISSMSVYKKDEVIFEEGSLGKKMFVIVSGNVSISKLLDNDDETVIAVLSKGDCFGEMAIISSEPRFATALAKADCKLIEINEVILRNTEPVLCLKLYKNLAWVLSERLKKREKKFNYSVSELRRLLSLCEKE